MTADMVVKFFENYGLIMTLLATSGIILVGCLKAIGIFSKVKDTARKYVYFASACIISIIACTIYLFVQKAFDWADWGAICVCVIGYTMALYAIYENTGIRALLRKILFVPIKNFIHKLFNAVATKNMSQDTILELAKGLGSEALSKLVSEISFYDRQSLDEYAEGELVADIDDAVKEESKRLNNTDFFSDNSVQN